MDLAIYEAFWAPVRRANLTARQEVAANVPLPVSPMDEDRVGPIGRVSALIGRLNRYTAEIVQGGMENQKKKAAEKAELIEVLQQRENANAQLVSGFQLEIDIWETSNLLGIPNLKDIAQLQESQQSYYEQGLRFNAAKAVAMDQLNSLGSCDEINRNVEDYKRKVQHALNDAEQHIRLLSEKLGARIFKSNLPEPVAVLPTNYVGAASFAGASLVGGPEVGFTIKIYHSAPRNRQPAPNAQNDLAVQILFAYDPAPNSQAAAQVTSNRSFLITDTKTLLEAYAYIKEHVTTIVKVIFSAEEKPHTRGPFSENDIKVFKEVYMVLGSSPQLIAPLLSRTVDSVKHFMYKTEAGKAITEAEEKKRNDVQQQCNIKRKRTFYEMSSAQ
eukprot:TRINITY_DN8192_c0_g1_i1.p1 TRINITY_DN8192_c0_g1~~TRINITY_DN8192_c0_g1_i1.p1  ORF type:complete len:386 (+),score=89.41 TRINITY_DN8192_c0_g1_i1:88-1245(+)